MMERTVFCAEFLDHDLRSRTTGYAVALRQVVFGKRASAAAGDAGDDDVMAGFFHHLSRRSMTVGALYRRVPAVTDRRYNQRLFSPAD
jgi:hypothetical protein